MNIAKAYILYIDDAKSRSYADTCADSCLKHDVKHELHLGYMGLTIEDLKKKTGWKVGREGIEDNDRQYVKEYNAALGHIDIWRKIASGDEACAILEHDAVVKGDLYELDVNDDEILHLGPRLDGHENYERPLDLSVNYVPIRRHEGAHAYAMTPKMAKFLVEQVEREARLLPTEALISVRNRYDLKFVEVDPPYVVCDMGGRVSYTHHDGVTDKNNFRHHPGFLAGITAKSSIEKYKIMDYKFTEDWFGGNIDNWVNLFKKFDKKKDDPLKILEIGSYEGRATTWLLDNMMDHADSLIYCVDTFKGSPEHSAASVLSLRDRFTFNVNVSKWPEKARTIVADSRIVLPSMCNNRETGTYDIIYVDGSHATLDVVNDGIFSLHLLKRGGLIIFDDYLWVDPIHGNQPVKKAIDFLDAHYPKYMERVLDGYQRAYRKAP